MLLKLLTASLLFSTGVLITACGEDKAPSSPQTTPPVSNTTTTQPSPNNAITSLAVGSVALGMNLDEALASIPNATSETAEDGEGIEWTAINVAANTLMNVLLNEEGSIALIRVFSPQFTTPQGVAVGMSVQDAADKLGGLTEIDFTEIESREFAKFKNMPDNTEFQIMSEEGMAGVYANGATTTMMASPSATISSIWIVED
ncbi:hypothetical protein [Candidatus Thiothrix anitrata]|jgi:hypothetical protein|uniref:Uncharacterized protein n=1 Tax=Candidatus Thiothrix anitrata TaxID=2823902 RepID=A0ABX7X836_9GAMM|nr:hypothetical protein [Candidatus Thiothrix anitrata]QTR51074.1 hypothetical protein J8380_05820 [Candidatus Thiothrix anitrata]